MRTDDLAPDHRAASRIVNAIREERIAISLTGKHENVLKIRTPLVVIKEEPIFSRKPLRTTSAPYRH